MAEKVKRLGLRLDHKHFLYFIDRKGNVCRKGRGPKGKAETLAENAVKYDKDYLFFLDKDGDVARSPRAKKKPPSSD